MKLTSLQVLSGDKDVGHVLPIPTDTMQLFDECRGQPPHDFRLYEL